MKKIEINSCSSKTQEGYEVSSYDIYINTSLEVKEVIDNEYSHIDYKFLNRYLKNHIL